MNDSLLIKWQQRVHHALDQFLPSDQHSPHTLHQAMRYSALNGGKRLRPMLVYAAAFPFDAPQQALDHCAMAVELMHVYSLIHDDLPAMDDDDLRRGQPTCHKAFDEATAILTGNALQLLAIDLICSIETIADQKKNKMIHCLTKAAGAQGIAGGQSLDLEQTAHDIQSLEAMYHQKTSCLFQACLQLGLFCTTASDPALEQHLITFGKVLGLIFQIQDDLFDIEGKKETLGKHVGQDLRQKKCTYPMFIGLEKTKKKICDLKEKLQHILDTLTPNNPMLHEIMNFVIKRQY